MGPNSMLLGARPGGTGVLWGLVNPPGTHNAGWGDNPARCSIMRPCGLAEVLSVLLA